MFKDLMKKQEKKQQEEEEVIPGTYKATCFSPQRKEYQILISKSEWKGDTTDIVTKEFTPRKQHPPSPFQKYKDKRRNELLDAYWAECLVNGFAFAMQTENIYRVGKIQTTTAINDYPLLYAKGRGGLLYSNKYLEEFPVFVQEKWSEPLSNGYYLCGFGTTAVPILLRKENFVIM